MYNVEQWSLDEFLVENSENKVMVELTDYVTRVIESIQFFRISPKKTVCLLTLQNGFDVVGTSGCVNPEHYNKVIGSKYALKEAISKASEIIAYAEQTKLFENKEVVYDK